MITDPSGIFTESIKAPNTSIIPLVVFVREGSLKKSISTNSVNLNHGTDDLLYFEPLLLNIPSIRESVDFENRNFKIGNISLSISNSAHKNNDRFSDSLPDIINSTCFIYWKVPRAKTLGDCLSVYTGKVKRMTHDDTKVTLQIEDQTQENLHKDLPIEFVSSDLEILDKYKNKPIPFVYGENKKHKSIIRPKNDGTDNFEVVSDTMSDLKGFDDVHPLRLMFDNKELTVIQGMNKFVSNYSNSSQYSIDNSNKIITLKREFSGDIDDEGNPIGNNSIADNHAEIRYIEKPSISLDNKINNENFYFYFYNNSYEGTLYNVDNTSQELINAGNLLDDNLNNFSNIFSEGEILPSKCRIFKQATGNEPVAFDAVLIKIIANYNHIANSDNFEHYELSEPIIEFVLEELEHFYNTYLNDTNGNIRIWSIARDSDDNLTYLLGGASGEFWDYNENNKFNYGLNTINNDLQLNYKTKTISVHIIPSNITTHLYDTHAVTLNANFYSLDLRHRGLVKNFFDNEIYVDINGREGNEDQDYNYDLIRRINLNSNEIYFRAMPDEPRGDHIFCRVKDNPLLLHILKEGTEIEIYDEDDDLRAKATVTHTDMEELQENTFFIYLNTTNDSNIDNVKIKIPRPFIELPCDIMRHLLINDIGFNGAIQQDELEIARNEHNGFYFSISQTEKINSKKLFENIAKQSKFFPKFRNDGSFGFNTIKDIYTKDDAELIEIRDIINYKFDRTKIDDLKTRVKVIYGKDNITDEYLKSTPYLEASNYFEGYENSYYGLEDDHRTSTLDFEAEYIQHEQTALLLRNFLMAWYANQHNIVSVDLPLKYMKYEIGDVVQFDSLINNLKLYGEDYTEIVSRNGQDIYPYFMIMETNKNIDKISLKLVQLHKNIVPEEQPQDDGFNRSIKPPKGGFIAEQVDNAVNKNPLLANIQELTNER